MRLDRLVLQKQRLYIPVNQFSSMTLVATNTASLGTGAAEMAAVSTNLAGALMDGATDIVSHCMMIPTEWDRRHPIKVRTIWNTASTTSADDFQWVFTYKGFTIDTDATATPTTALDTVIAAQTLGTTTTLMLKASPWGIMNGGSLDDTDEFMAFIIKCSTQDSDPYLFGVQFEFTPRFYRGLTKESPEWSAS